MEENAFFMGATLRPPSFWQGGGALSILDLLNVCGSLSPLPALRALSDLSVILALVALDALLTCFFAPLPPFLFVSFSSFHSCEYEATLLVWPPL